MSNWDYKTLDQMGTVQRGRSKHRPRNDSRLFGGKYPFIQTADVKNAPFYISEYSTTYNDAGLAQSKLWDAGTLCITIAANIADTGILAIPACFPDSILGFRSFDDISDVRFVKYCFDILQRDCKSISQGAAQDNLSWEKLSTIKFPCPPLPVQRRIADILSAYDDLIENNWKQIKLLEEAAQRLYKEWFIDLRFPGHEHTPIINGVPEGWKMQTVGGIIDFEIGGGWGNDYPTNGEDVPGYVIRGTDINGLTHGDISAIPFRYHSKSNIASRILKHGDIVFEVSGGGKNEGVGKTVLITNALLSCFNAPVICASFCKLIRLNSLEISYYLYESIKYWRFCGRISEFEKKSASSIINYRWKDFLNQQVIPIPSDTVMSRYNALIAPMYNKLIRHSLSIEKSALIRNSLLSKLMNGELTGVVKNCR